MLELDFEWWMGSFKLRVKKLLFGLVYIPGICHTDELEIGSTTAEDVSLGRVSIMLSGLWSQSLELPTTAAK